MKKRLVMILLAICLATTSVTLAGCGSNQQSQRANVGLEASVAEVFTTGMSYNNTTNLVINLLVKNNFETNYTVLLLQGGSSATLDGSPLAAGYLPEDSPYALSWTNMIAPGSEGQGQVVFELPAKEGIVELTIVSETTDYKDIVEILSMTIDLAAVEQIAQESEFEITLDAVYYARDDDGKDCIVLDMTFTNNSSNPTSYSSSLKTELFQNGISLKSGYLSYRDSLSDWDLISNSFTDIKQGSSIEFRAVYVLYDRVNPVEMTIKDASDYHNVFVIFEEVIDVTTGGGTPLKIDAPEGDVTWLTGTWEVKKVEGFGITLDYNTLVEEDLNEYFIFSSSGAVIEMAPGGGGMCAMTYTIEGNTVICTDSKENTLVFTHINDVLVLEDSDMTITLEKISNL